MDSDTEISIVCLCNGGCGGSVLPAPGLAVATLSLTRRLARVPGAGPQFHLHWQFTVSFRVLCRAHSG